MVIYMIPRRYFPYIYPGVVLENKASHDVKVYYTSNAMVLFYSEEGCRALAIMLCVERICIIYGGHLVRTLHQYITALDFYLVEEKRPYMDDN